MSRYSGEIIQYNKYSCFVLVEWEEDGFPEASDHEMDIQDREEWASYNKRNRNQEWSNY